jgi:hypothetical protein
MSMEGLTYSRAITKPSNSTRMNLQVTVKKILVWLERTHEEEFCRDCRDFILVSPELPWNLVHFGRAIILPSWENQSKAAQCSKRTIAQYLSVLADLACNPLPMILRISHRASRLCWRSYATSSTSSSTAPPMLLKIRCILPVWIAPPC